jgi:histidinol-phosphate aminotransferase
MQRARSGFYPSVANFLSIDVGRDAGPIYQALLREGVIVRPVAGYGLPRHLRVTVGREHENRRFVDALDRVLVP